MLCCSVNRDLQFIVCFAIVLRRLCYFVFCRSDLTYLPRQFGGRVQALFFGLLHEFCATILLKTLYYMLRRQVEYI